MKQHTGRDVDESKESHPGIAAHRPLLCLTVWLTAVVHEASFVPLWPSIDDSILTHTHTHKWTILTDSSTCLKLSINFLVPSWESLTLCYVHNMNMCDPYCWARCSLRHVIKVHIYFWTWDTVALWLWAVPCPESACRSYRCHSPGHVWSWIGTPPRQSPPRRTRSQTDPEWTTFII